MKKWILSATAITIFLACGDRHRKSTDNLPEEFAGAPEDEGSSTNPPPQPTPTPTPIVTPTALPIPDPNPTPAPVPKLRILMTRYAFVSGETRMLGSIALDANSNAWPVPPNFSVKIHVADENCGSEAVSVQDSTVTAVLTAKDGTQRCSFQLDLFDEKGELLVSSQRNLDVLKADKVKLSQTPAGHYYHDMGLGLSKLGAEYDPKTHAIGEHCVTPKTPYKFHNRGEADVGTFEERVEVNSFYLDDFPVIFNNFNTYEFMEEPESQSKRYVENLTEGYARLDVKGVASQVSMGIFQWDSSIPLTVNTKNCTKDMIDGLQVVRKVQIYLWAGQMEPRDETIDTRSLMRNVFDAQLTKEQSEQMCPEI